MDPELDQAQERRAAIEAAFEAAENETPESPEAGQQAEVLQEASAGEAGSQAAEGAESAAEGTPAETPEAVQAEAAPVADEAPHSWKAPLKAKWATVDPEVQAEIQRREREITRTLTETSNERQLASKVREVISPYSQRFQALNIHPLQAIQNLLQADLQLTTGNKHTRASLVAKLIKDYDVDIRELDEVLSGQTSPAATEEARIQRLLDQQLAPVRQQLTTYQQRELAAQQEQEAALAQEIDAAATNRKDYPHFEAVRESMADIIEISARRGVTLDLKTAYNRAVASDPQLAAQLESVRQAEALKAAATKAQRAKNASSSVNGSPTSAVPRVTDTTDRRATISAAFDAHGAG